MFTKVSSISEIFCTRVVEALTGIFCSICESLMGHDSRRVFDRRIDLDWFQDDYIELIV